MRLFSVLLAVAAPLAGASAATPREPAVIRVRLETAYGPVVLALEARKAPRTVANFMGYVDDGRFDGVSFYRSARNRQAGSCGRVSAKSVRGRSPATSA